MDDPGLVAVTKGLSTESLLRGYTAGCFPWSGRPARWYCPDPRAIFDLENVHFSRRLLRTVRKGAFDITFDTAFRWVMESCVEAHQESCWIDSEIIEKYTAFHKQGYAHSVEAWLDDELVGGLYGVHIHGLFAGESMFSRRTDASKVAFYHLVEKLRDLKVELFDAQVLNPHTQSLGAFEITREEFLARLAKAVQREGSGISIWR